MLVACSGFFVLGQKSKAERARIWFPLRKQDQELSGCFMARALLVSGAEIPEDAGGGNFSTEPDFFPIFPYSVYLCCWIYTVLAAPLAGQNV